MSEGFYSRKTGQWWDQVIERREAGDDDEAFDICHSMIVELDDKAARVDHLEDVRRHAEEVSRVLGVNDGHDPDASLALAAKTLRAERREAVAMAERLTREADSLRDQFDAAVEACSTARTVLHKVRPVVSHLTIVDAVDRALRDLDAVVDGGEAKP